jgi:hypothetical protein
VDDSNLAFHDDIGASLTDASATVIVDMDTGERVAYFAELDANALEADPPRPDEQPLYLHPAQRLGPGHRFAVGIKKTLKAASGGDLAIPVGFQAILDGKTTGHARLDAIAPSYDDIFAALDVAPEDLVVAWDFVIADDESVR